MSGPTLTDDHWFDEVVRICKERGYSDWFYADRAAWIEDKKEMTPLQAVEYQQKMFGRCRKGTAT